MPNGPAAVEHVRTHPVDLVIVDLRMPGMDGLQVVQAINQVAPDTEVVLLTAYGSMDTAVQALRLRIHDYLTKPASPPQVLASVKKGLARRAAKLRAKAGAGEVAEGDDLGRDVELPDGTVVDFSRARSGPAEG